MSSLKATQSDGYYIPPEYLESGAYKKKSLNQFNKNKGHNQYLVNSVVRFEMPYDGFCTSPSCQAHVGKGTRFNAHKAHVDDYFTTKIWEFTMNCRACATSKFYIRTNPQGRCFDYCSGIKKKNEGSDSIDVCEFENQQDDDVDKTGEQKSLQKLNDEPETTTSQTSAIDKLQQEKIGERKAIAERDAIILLMNQNEKTMADDAMTNSKIRSNYRMKRKAKRQRLDEAHAKGLGMGIELSKSTETDALVAQNAFKGNVRSSKSREKEKQKFASIRTSSIFSNAGLSGYKSPQRSKRNESKRRKR